MAFSLHHSSTWCMGIQAGWKGGIVRGSNGSRGAERKMLTQLCPGRLCWKFPSIHWLLNRAPHMRTHWGCDGRSILLELHSVIKAHEWIDYEYVVWSMQLLNRCFPAQLLSADGLHLLYSNCTVMSLLTVRPSQSLNKNLRLRHCWS